MNDNQFLLPRVLLVEDDQVDEELTRRALADGNSRFRVESANGVQVALEKLKLGEFDVVLLDLGLPECFGLEALQKVRDVDRHTPVVILTGLCDEQTALNAISQGAQDYIVKGNIDAESLGRSVRYAMQRRDSEIALEERVKLANLSARIGEVLTCRDELSAALEECCEALVGHLDVEFAGIWMTDLQETRWNCKHSPAPRACLAVHADACRWIGLWMAHSLTQRYILVGSTLRS